MLNSLPDGDPLVPALLAPVDLHENVHLKRFFLARNEGEACTSTLALSFYVSICQHNALESYLKLISGLIFQGENNDLFAERDGLVEGMGTQFFSLV